MRAATGTVRAKKPGLCGPGLRGKFRRRGGGGALPYFRIISFTVLPAGIIGSTCSV